MVKERDEQMTEAEENEREDKKRRRRERWEKFKRRASALFTVVLVLSVIGGGGASYYFLGECEWPLTKKTCEPKEPPTPVPSVRADNFGESCLEDKAAQTFCIRVRYATTRQVSFFRNEQTAQLEPKFDTEKSERIHYGSGDVAVPKKFAKRDSAGKLIVKPKFPLDSPTDVLETISKSDSFRTAQEKGTRVGLTTLSARNGATSEDERLTFLASLKEDVQQSSSKSVMLYVHGFNQTFDQATLTAAQIALDMSYATEDDKNLREIETADLAYGVPVIFSWPNSESFVAYGIDRENVAASAPDFANLLDLLIDEVGAQQVNIIVHSMGNRLFINGIIEYAKQYLSTSDGSANLRIIHAAADLNHREYLKAMRVFEDALKTNGKTNLQPRVTIYASKNDTALRASRGLVEAALRCRLGKISSWCPIINFPKEFGDRYNAVDASGFVLYDTLPENSSFTDRLGNTIFKDFGHSYFENAPQILADAGCEFANLGPSSKPRALKEVYRKEYLFGKAPYWQISLPDGELRCKAVEFETFDKCESSPELYPEICGDTEVVPDPTSEPLIQQISTIIYFDLMSAKLRDDSKAMLSQYVSQLKQGDIRRISIIAYTDTAGELPYNDDLSLRRALVVSSYLENSGIESSLIDASGGGEVQIRENNASNKGDGVRAAENRRAEVTAEITLQPHLGDE